MRPCIIYILCLFLPSIQPNLLHMWTFLLYHITWLWQHIKLLSYTSASRHNVWGLGYQPSDSIWLAGSENMPQDMITDEFTHPGLKMHSFHSSSKVNSVLVSRNTSVMVKGQINGKVQLRREREILLDNWNILQISNHKWLWSCTLKTLCHSLNVNQSCAPDHEPLSSYKRTQQTRRPVDWGQEYRPINCKCEVIDLQCQMYCKTSQLCVDRLMRLALCE